MDDDPTRTCGEPAGPSPLPDGDVVVVVPVKAFDEAKARLAEVLDGSTRARLARAMADRVVAAAAPLPVVVACDDGDVARWADAAGCAVAWTPHLGLNGAVDRTVDRLEARGVRRVVVAHADLPFATGLTTLADAGADEVLLVPDRRHDGTNVVSIPTGRTFRFRYGPDSFAAHRGEASRAGLTVRVVDSEALGWDIDEPGDLVVPDHLGALPAGIVATDSTGGRGR